MPAEGRRVPGAPAPPSPLAGAASLAEVEWVPGMPDGVVAFTTTRACGSYALAGDEPVGPVTDRWLALHQGLCAGGVSRLACARQVHGGEMAHHGAGWSGWLRLDGVDGHLTSAPGTAVAVTVADCTPVFIAHPRGAVAALHAGWRGTALGILPAGLAALARDGFPADECLVHLGPAICGPCYQVGPEVLAAVYGTRGTEKGHLDVRTVLREQALAAGVRSVTTSPWCTRCHAGRFHSHRGGDAGRQLGVIALVPPGGGGVPGRNRSGDGEAP